ncbi:MAG TPA: hypothetical protein VFJ16_00820 [Longimicrobium sp.]|nr:hypothetical protein [Longimicrobium sp.]
MSFSQLRPLSFGEILDGSFTLYRRHFASFFLTALIPQIPILIWSAVYTKVVASATAASPDDPTALLGSLAAVLVFLPLVGAISLVGLGGVVFQFSRAYTGTPVGTGEALKRGMQRLPSLLGGGIIWAMMVWFGFMLCIVPGILALIVTFAWIPAVVLERRGPIDGIQRSINLARDAWGEIFLMQIVVYLITFLPGIAVGAMALYGQAATAASGSLSGIQVLSQVLSGLVRALTIPFSMGCTVLMYYDRRVRTEALDVQMMAESLGGEQPAGGYPAGGYAPGGYPAGGYPAGGYAPGGPGQGGYPQAGYPQGGTQGGYGSPQGYPGAPGYPAGPASPGAGPASSGVGPAYPAGGTAYPAAPEYPPAREYPPAPQYPPAPEYPAGGGRPGAEGGSANEGQAPSRGGPGDPGRPADPTLG